MKRSLLLLTAVVLATVLLSGCFLNPFTWGKVKVSYDLEKDAFTGKNPKYVSKKTVTFAPKFVFKQKDDEVNNYDITVKVDDEVQEDIEPVTLEDGFKLPIPKVGEKTISITIKKTEKEA